MINVFIMPNTHENILNIFNKKINLLIIDDEPLILDLTTNLFSSPLFNITTGSTLQEALIKIDAAESPWHCWILDINIERKEDGLTILEKYPKFPFAIMLSGLRSMTIASKAMQYGAIKVYDKSPESIDLLYDGVCKVAPLGFILDGKYSHYLPHFQLLVKNYFTNHEEWANMACISVRQLERICIMHTSLTPRFITSLYYSLYYLLIIGTNNITAPLDSSTKSLLSDKKDFYHSHIDFFTKNICRYKEVLSEKILLSLS